MDKKEKFKKDLIKGQWGEYDMAVYLSDKGFKTLHFNNDAKWDIKSMSPKTGMMTFFEIKSDFLCKDEKSDTGNLAIEIRYNGEKSGLSSTESQTWVHFLSENGDIKGGFIFDVDYLKDLVKRLVRENKAKLTKGGDFNASQLVLVPIKELF